jgi:hypothetical protein
MRPFRSRAGWSLALLAPASLSWRGSGTPPKATVSFP